MFKQTAKKFYHAMMTDVEIPNMHALPLPPLPRIFPMSETVAPVGVRHRIRKRLPAVMMRSGTSKGLFVHHKHMPARKDEWEKVLLSVMGSKFGDRKQIDGIGGATSTTSKVAIVSKSTRPDADVNYTFAQVAVGQEKVDFSGNCGNMASGVGPFALDEGLVKVMPGQTEVDIRVYNTNTDRILVETVQVDDEGNFWEFGDCRIGGVKSTGSEIKVQFIEPAGSMTGRLFPTSQRSETLAVNKLPSFDTLLVQATLMDAANPFVFVDSTSLPAAYHINGPAAESSLAIIEAIRCAGAVKMGLATDLASAALVRGTPKIAVVSAPASSVGTLDRGSDIQVQSFSMGKPHPTLQLTGAVCLSSAVCMEGTVPYRLSILRGFLTPAGTPPEDEKMQKPFSTTGEREVKMKHASGYIDAIVSKDVVSKRIKTVSVPRTARRIFTGEVMFDVQS